MHHESKSGPRPERELSDEVHILGKKMGPFRSFLDGLLIAADGTVLRTWPRPRVASEHYTVLLQRNYIVMHATVMYRRTVFDTVTGFDPAFRACEDYDLYLCIARQFPIACHDHVVAEYRQHHDNMTHNATLMLSTALAALRAQQQYVAGNHTYETAYKIGEKSWQDFYVKRSLKEALAGLKNGVLGHSLHVLPLLWRYGQSRLRWVAQYTLGVARNRLGVGWRRLQRLPVGQVDLGALQRVMPLHCATASPTAAAVDQYYLEHFLRATARDVQGRVLEVGDGAISRRLQDNPRPTGTTQVTLVDDLKVASELPSDSYDCLILPHCLQRDYELQAAIQTVYRLLRPGGVLLATLPGISIHQWVDTTYWAFTAKVAQRLFAETFPPAQLTVTAYGNVLATIACLYGIAAQELRPEELDYRDVHYQIVVAVRAVKPEA